jgi:ABC-type amino acid transport/signal transduction systems, periplasmic component/domain
MKNRVFIAIAIAVLILAVSVSSIACGKQGTKIDASSLKTLKAGVLTVGSDTTYPPMEYKEGDKIVGFDVDLAQAIADKIGLKLDYQTTAWDGIFPALIAHKFDIVMSSVSITDDRKKEMDFSTPYYKVDQTALVKADSSIDSIEKLKGKTAGVQIGTTGEIEAKKIASLKVNTYDDNMLAIEDLKAGRVDAVICDSIVGDVYVKDNKDVKVGFVITTDESYGIAFAKDTPELRDAVNAALKSLTDDGTFAGISKKWFGERK